MNVLSDLVSPRSMVLFHWWLFLVDNFQTNILQGEVEGRSSNINFFFRLSVFRNRFHGISWSSSFVALRCEEYFCLRIGISNITDSHCLMDFEKHFSTVSVLPAGCACGNVFCICARMSRPRVVLRTFSSPEPPFPLVTWLAERRALEAAIGHFRYIKILTWLRGLGE